MRYNSKLSGQIEIFYDEKNILKNQNRADNDFGYVLQVIEQIYDMVGKGKLYVRIHIFKTWYVLNIRCTEKPDNNIENNIRKMLPECIVNFDLYEDKYVIKIVL